MTPLSVEESSQLEDPALRRVALFFVLFLSMISIATPGSVSLLLVILVGQDIDLDLPKNLLAFFKNVADFLAQIDKAPFKYIVTIWYSVPAILTAVVLGTRFAWRERLLKFFIAGCLFATLLISLYPLFIFESTTASDWRNVSHGIGLFSYLPKLTDTAFQLCISYLALLTGLQIILGKKGEPK
jgi:hypothetical protein